MQVPAGETRFGRAPAAGPGGRRRPARRRHAALWLLLVLGAALGASPAGAEGPPERRDTRPVMFVGNNHDGTADIIDARTFKRLARINTIPDRDQRLAEIATNPERLAFFLAIRIAIGDNNDQYTDDLFTSHDGRFVYVSRPSFADVVAISLETQKIVWRTPVEGQRSDHMGISPDGTRLLVSDSTAKKVLQLDTATGRKSGEFASGDTPHENNYSRDGRRIFHASIGRVYTPVDRSESGGAPGLAPPLGSPLELAGDTSKGERYLQINDGNSLGLLKRWDMGQKLEEAGYPGMSSAVRPMAVAPDERFLYLQVSFHHGFVEFDTKAERVLRVARLPISEEARNTPPEQYVLDSAHHGLAMNSKGTKLCAAGTMSDYAAIVSRRTFAAKTFPVGKKPYWSTNGVDGNLCWVSVSGDDRVVVLDYDSEREVARIPVGDHPQRVRVGAVRLAALPGLPLAPGAPDGAPPLVRTAGVSSRCARSSFVLSGTVADQSRVRRVEVTLRGRRLLRTAGSTFRVRVPFRGLPPGRHAVVVRATDDAGNRQRSVVRFRRCAKGAQVRFTG